MAEFTVVFAPGFHWIRSFSDFKVISLFMRQFKMSDILLT